MTYIVALAEALYDAFVLVTRIEAAGVDVSNSLV